jgi:GNAT superfamily N-acetyltransferase
LDEERSVILGFVSLCADSIPLSNGEQNDYGVTYTNVPAVKIARLAVNNQYHHFGYGRKLIDYSVYLAMKIRENIGVKFMTLDCYNHRVPFYEKFMFTKNQNQRSIAEDLPKSMIMCIDDYLSIL